MCWRLKLNFKEAHLSSFPSLEEALHDGKEARSSATGVLLVYSLPRYSDGELGMPCLCVEERLGPFLAFSSMPVVTFRMSEFSECSEFRAQTPSFLEYKLR